MLVFCALWQQLAAAAAAASCWFLVYFFSFLGSNSSIQYYPYMFVHCIPLNLFVNCPFHMQEVVACEGPYIVKNDLKILSELSEFPFYLWKSLPSDLQF